MISFDFGQYEKLDFYHLLAHCAPIIPVYCRRYILTHKNTNSYYTDYQKVLILKSHSFLTNKARRPYTCTCVCAVFYTFMFYIIYISEKGTTKCSHLIKKS